MAGDLPVFAENMLFFKLQQGVAVIAPAGQAAAIPIIGDRQIAKIAFIGDLIFVECSFNKITFPNKLQ